MLPRDRSMWPMPGPRLLGVALVAVLAAALWLWTRSTGAPVAAPAMQHAVVIHLRLSDGRFGAAGEVPRLMELERRIEAVVEAASVGELDGNEVGAGEFVVFTRGPDADRLYATLEPLLRASPLAKGGFVVKRYGAAGDPDAGETRVELSP